MTLRYDFPSDIYVDKYELAAIAVSRKVSTRTSYSVCFLFWKKLFNVASFQVEFYIDNKFIDVETPAHKSDPFVLYVVNYTLPDTANKLIETEFPIHLRYQQAAEDSRYKEVRFGDAYSDVQMLYLCKGPNTNWKLYPLNSGEWIPVSTYLNGLEKYRSTHYHLQIGRVHGRFCSGYLFIFTSFKSLPVVSRLNFVSSIFILLAL